MGLSLSWFQWPESGGKRFGGNSTRKGKSCSLWTVASGKYCKVPKFTVIIAIHDLDAKGGRNVLLRRISKKCKKYNSLDTG